MMPQNDYSCLLLTVLEVTQNAIDVLADKSSLLSLGKIKFVATFVNLLVSWVDTCFYDYLNYCGLNLWVTFEDCCILTSLSQCRTVPYTIGQVTRTE